MADVQNPPAFAAAAGGENQCCQTGMTLRDWFAGQALAVIGGMYANDRAEFNGVRDAAETAWLLADEMMAVRALASEKST